MRIFLDANILFSGAQDASPMQQMLARLMKSGVLITSDYAWMEAERNIVAKRPDWLTGLRVLRAKVSMTVDIADCGEVKLDAADRPILGAAIAARCTHLLTGDRRHFRDLFGKTIGGVKIVSARMLAEDLWGKPHA